MEEIDTIICLKKRNKTKRISKKLLRDQKIEIKNLAFFCFHCMKQGTRSSVFWRKWHHKIAFHKNKRPININELDIEEIVLSHKKSYSKDSFKYCIGYRHKGNAFPSPLCVKLPQMNA